jgi:predicted metal-dependent phosphoesterase TrpH
VIETIRVDLHCHSSMSDGDHSPAYVAHSIAAVGAVWASLTDHNTLSGQPQFRAVLEERGVSSVVGLEIDARSPAGVLHLLGYGLDQHNEALLDALRTLRQPLRTSARHWVGRARSRTTRPFFARRSGAAPDAVAAPPRPPTTAGAIRLIHEAGGLVFLAHPLAGIGTIARLEEALTWLQPEGLDGLEAFHKQYLPETQDALLEIAERRDLLTVAGSDFHGVHHSDGGSPGADMPLVHWRQFMAALGIGPQDGLPTPYQDRVALQRGHVGD